MRNPPSVIRMWIWIPIRTWQRMRMRMRMRGGGRTGGRAGQTSAGSVDSVASPG